MSIMSFFIILAFLATVAVLLAGGLSMVRGGRYNNGYDLGPDRGR